MPLGTISPLAPLRPLGSVSATHFHPLDLSDDGGGGDFGISTDCLDPSCFGFGDTGTGAGGTGPGDCNPEDPTCATQVGSGGSGPGTGPGGITLGCDLPNPACCFAPSSPECTGDTGGDGGGGGGGGGVISVSTPGVTNASFVPTGSCGCGLFDVACHLKCSGLSLERIAIFLLGLILIILGIYLFKPVQNVVVSGVKNAGRAATVAAA